MNRLLSLTARLVIGHRGAAAEAPENTLTGFRHALAQGAEALELDVHATADGVAVVIHDPTLERTTDRRGAVADLAWADVRAADAGARFTPDGGRSYPFRGRDTRVPALAEVLAAFPGIPLLIDVKTPRAQDPAHRAILDHGAVDRVVLASLEDASLRALRGTELTLGATRRDAARLWLAAHLGLPLPAARCRLFAVPDRYRGIPVATRPFVRAAARLGSPVHVWTVDDPARAIGLWGRGVGGIITNRPGTILAARARAGLGEFPL